MEYMYEELPNSSSPARRRGVFATAALLLGVATLWSRPSPTRTPVDLSAARQSRSRAKPFRRVVRLRRAAQRVFGLDPHQHRLRAVLDRLLHAERRRTHGELRLPLGAAVGRHLGEARDGMAERGAHQVVVLPPGAALPERRRHELGGGADGRGADERLAVERLRFHGDAEPDRLLSSATPRSRRARPSARTCTTRSASARRAGTSSPRRLRRASYWNVACICPYYSISRRSRPRRTRLSAQTQRLRATSARSSRAGARPCTRRRPRDRMIGRRRAATDMKMSADTWVRVLRGTMARLALGIRRRAPAAPTAVRRRAPAACGSARSPN